MLHVAKHINLHAVSINETIVRRNVSISSTSFAHFCVLANSDSEAGTSPLFN